MYASFAVVFLCAGVLSSVVTPVCRNVALRLNLVDRPDGARKLHRRPIPPVGGIPILLSIAAACGCLPFLPWAGTKAATAALSAHWPFLATLTVVFVTGFVDDVVGLRPRQKLLGLVVAAGLACACGIRIHSCGAWQLPIWLSVPLTILWLVASATAFNLIDGLDGLATGVALFATFGLLVSASLRPESNDLLVLALVPMAGALLGFLPYNFHPASIFLGDSGSLMIGFLLGSASVLWSQKSASWVGMTAPVMMLTIPLLEVILSIARRFLRGRSIFCADRGHIHHRLLDRGLSPRRTALLLYGAGLLATALAVAQTWVPQRIAGWVLVLFCLCVWAGIRSLGYAEFAVAWRLVRSGTLQHSLNARLNLRTIEKSLHAAESTPECWIALCEACQRFGFSEVRFRAGDHVFQKQFGSRLADDCWNIQIPLPNGDYVNFTRPQNSPVWPMGVAPMLDTVSKSMAEKCVASPDLALTSSEHTSRYAMRNTAERRRNDAGLLVLQEGTQ